MAWHDRDRVYPTKEKAFEAAAELRYLDAGEHFAQRVVGGWKLIAGNYVKPGDLIAPGEVRAAADYQDVTPHDVDACKDEPCPDCYQDRVAAAEAESDAREDR